MSSNKIEKTDLISPHFSQYDKNNNQKSFNLEKKKQNISEDDKNRI